MEFYLSTGEYMSGMLKTVGWREWVVDQLGSHVGRTDFGLRGFTRSNLV